MSNLNEVFNQEIKPRVLNNIRFIEIYEILESRFINRHGLTQEEKDVIANKIAELERFIEGLTV